MSPEEIRAIQEHLPPEKLMADDAQEFARELVAQRKLTPYQAMAVYQGKGQGLVLGNYVCISFSWSLLKSLRRDAVRLPQAVTSNRSRSRPYSTSSTVTVRPDRR